MSFPKDFTPNYNVQPYDSMILNDRFYNTNYESLSSSSYYSNQDNMSKSTGNKSNRRKLCASSNRFVKAFTPANYVLDTTTTNTIDSTDVTHSSIATEPILAFDNNSFEIVEHLDLNTFKIKQCTITNQHNHKRCQYYHNQKDRKRPGNFYTSDLCENIEKDGCINGDNCMKAHNGVEQLYKPDKYKTKFCTYYPNNLQSCEYGAFCSFAHSESDIVIELIHNYEFDDDFYLFHFKTVWCPFNLTQHDKGLCVYAHNWQDYRRKPHIHNYSPMPCPNWKSTDFIVNYEDGCPLKEKCTKCHGWKENEYHPLNYKTKPCPSGMNCQKVKDCPYYHNVKEKRHISANVANKVFRYTPRNRIISNTFKIRYEDKNNPFRMNTMQAYNYRPNSNPSKNYINPNHYQMIHNSDYEEGPMKTQETLLSMLNNISTNNFNTQMIREEHNQKNIRKASLDVLETWEIYQNPNSFFPLDSDFGKIKKKVIRPIEPATACTMSFDREKMFKEIMTDASEAPKSNYDSMLAVNSDSRVELNEPCNQGSSIDKENNNNNNNEDDYGNRYKIQLYMQMRILLDRLHT